MNTSERVQALRRRMNANETSQARPRPKAVAEFPPGRDRRYGPIFRFPEGHVGDEDPVKNEIRFRGGRPLTRHGKKGESKERGYAIYYESQGRHFIGVVWRIKNKWQPQPATANAELLDRETRLFSSKDKAVDHLIDLWE